MSQIINSILKRLYICGSSLKTAKALEGNPLDCFHAIYKQNQYNKNKIFVVNSLVIHVLDIFNVAQPGFNIHL